MSNIKLHEVSRLGLNKSQISNNIDQSPPTISFKDKKLKSIKENTKYLLKFLINGKYEKIGGKKYTVQLASDSELVSFSTTRWNNVEKGWTLETYISTKTPETINLSFKIDGIDTNSLNLSIIAKQITKPEKCICKKAAWSAEDLKYIVTELRKREKTGIKQLLRDVNNTKNFAMGEPIKDANGNKIYKELSIYDDIASDKKQVSDRLFYLNRDENIQDLDKSYTKLAEVINFIFLKLEAKKCINKIHLLSQIYHETERFGSCYESDASAEKSGEDFYRGRGLIMLTKKANYKKFYIDTYKKEPTEDELKSLVPKVAKNLSNAKETTVWYLKNSKIREYFDEEDSVNNVSACINYPKALITKKYDVMFGLKERKLFFNLLKEILDYENCK